MKWLQPAGNRLRNCGNSGVIENCCNLGVITGIAPSDQAKYYINAAGICGQNSGRISNCYNNALIQISGDVYNGSPQYGAGIVADNEGSVLNCFNAGSIMESIPSPCPLGGISAKMPAGYRIATTWGR